MFAAVDLGSNSFRLHVGRHDGGAIRILKTARDPVRLGGGLDGNGNLTETAMQSALSCLRNFRAVLSEYQLDAVRVVATNALRVAKNAAAFVSAAEHAVGYPVEIISGEEEGRLIYMGVASALAKTDEDRLVIDIGGGSTELILGKGLEIAHVDSFSIGTVAHSQAFFASGVLDAAAFDAAIFSARSCFEDGVAPYRPKYWQAAYGSSGTMRVISEIVAKNAIGDGSMSLSNLEQLKARLMTFGHVDRVDLLGIKPERVGSMVGGLAVLMGVMQEVGVDSLTAVDAGLRMGVLWDLHLRATSRDRREQSVQEFMQRFRADQDRAVRVANSADALYAQLKPTSGIYSRYLYWSALLHEIGRAVSHTGYHKHSAYMVEHADLSGFTGREQALLARLILAQKGNLRKIDGALGDADFAKAVLALRLAAILMHSRVDTDVSELRLKMKGRIELELKRDWTALHPTISYWLSKERGWWNEVGVELNVTIPE